jgi:hypothetical protein
LHGVLPAPPGKAARMMADYRYIRVILLPPTLLMEMRRRAFLEVERTHRWHKTAISRRYLSSEPGRPEPATFARTNMANDWHSMTDNQLRAHLDCALSEREGSVALEECGYSDEEFCAITQESRRRRFQVFGLRRMAVQRSDAHKGH